MSSCKSPARRSGADEIRPALWRLAGSLAEQRDMKARAMECLEKALDAEFKRSRHR